MAWLLTLRGSGGPTWRHTPGALHHITSCDCVTQCAHCAHWAPCRMPSRGHTDNSADGGKVCTMLLSSVQQREPVVWTCPVLASGNDLATGPARRGCATLVGFKHNQCLQHALHQPLAHSKHHGPWWSVVDCAGLGAVQWQMQGGLWIIQYNV